jgi:hypothetical protein
VQTIWKRGAFTLCRPGAHAADPEARFYDPAAKYAAIRADHGCEIEISGNTLRDLSQARIFLRANPVDRAARTKSGASSVM